MIGKPFFHPPRNELQDPNMTANPFSICKMNACRLALLSAHFCIECFTQRAILPEMARSLAGACEDGFHLRCQGAGLVGCYIPNNQIIHSSIIVYESAKH